MQKQSTCYIPEKKIAKDAKFQRLFFEGKAQIHSPNATSHADGPKIS